MLVAIRNRTCFMKNSVFSIIKSNQPIRFNSQIASRYPDYQMVYKFPPVRIASMVNKLKLYQTVATGIGIPTTMILAAFDIVETQTTIVFALSGIVWCFAFYTIGFLGQNRVGFLYLKNDQKSVKIVYTDFWGKRVDTDVDINDICPLNDLPSSMVDSLYYSLRRYSTKKTLKFNMKYGTIVDHEKFQLIFGNPFLNVKH